MPRRAIKQAGETCFSNKNHGLRWTPFFRLATKRTWAEVVHWLPDRSLTVGWMNSLSVKTSTKKCILAGPCQWPEQMQKIISSSIISRNLAKQFLHWHLQASRLSNLSTRALLGPLSACLRWPNLMNNVHQNNVLVCATLLMNSKAYPSSQQTGTSVSSISKQIWKVMPVRATSCDCRSYCLLKNFRREPS